MDLDLPAIVRDNIIALRSIKPTDSPAGALINCVDLTLGIFPENG